MIGEDDTRGDILNLSEDDCIVKIRSFGEDRLEKFIIETKNGDVQTVGEDDNQEATEQEFDFGDGCLIGAYGLVTEDEILQIGFFYEVITVIEEEPV